MKNIAYLLLLSFGLLSASCKKTSDDPAEPAVDSTDTFTADFTWTGRQYIHSPITFTTNHPSRDVTLTWYFGNEYEETKEGTSINYTFTQPGTYTVTVATANGGVLPVSKEIVITNGVSRITGTNSWNCLLYTVKNGFPGAIPNKSFMRDLEISVVNSTTVAVSDIPELPFRGPYQFHVERITDTDMLFKSKNDTATKLEYRYDTYAAGLQIRQVRNDTTWRINAGASIYN